MSVYQSYADLKTTAVACSPKMKLVVTLVNIVCQQLLWIYFQWKRNVFFSSCRIKHSKGEIFKITVYNFECFSFQSIIICIIYSIFRIWEFSFAERTAWPLHVVTEIVISQWECNNQAAGWENLRCGACLPMLLQANCIVCFIRALMSMILLHNV